MTFFPLILQENAFFSKIQQQHFSFDLKVNFDPLKYRIFLWPHCWSGPPTFLWKNVFDLHFPFNTKGSRTVCPKRAFYALNHTLLYPFVRYSRYGLRLSLRTWSDGIMSLRTLLLHRLRLDKMLHIFSSLNGTTKTTIPRELKMKALGRQWLYFQTTHHI